MVDPELPTDLQQRQTGIDREILDALVEATPATCNAAILDLDFSNAGTTAIGHVISNPDGASESVEPTEELFLATRRLDLLFREFGFPLRAARYEIRAQDAGRWNLR